MNPVGAVGTYRSVGFSPRLSVVVPAHNRAPRLPALLAALLAELDRHGAAELILVDSASADETGRVAAAAAAGDPARAGVVPGPGGSGFWLLRWRVDGVR